MKRALAALTTLLLGAAAPPPQLSAGATYQPRDNDERGLWMDAAESERLLKTSNFVMRDPALNAYIRQVFCRTVGEAECAAIRIYVMRTPYFNASMAPNGVLQIWSGLLLRIRDEAELAAVLGHEYTHYANLHSLKEFRDLKAKTGAMTWLAFLPYGVGLIAQVGVAGSIFSYSRDMESEADAGSVTLLGHAGYRTASASAIWVQLRAEMDATALARGTKSRKDRNGGMFATHPPTAERMTALAALAAKETEGAQEDGRDAYRAAIRPWWPALIDDQIKLNDFGATELLLDQLAIDGWTPELLFARGELYRTRGRPDDLTAAADYYRQAIALAGAPAEAWRGLGLSLLRSGAQADGQAALKTYLAARPNCADRAMIAMLAGEAK